MQPIYGESQTYQNQFLVSVPQLNDPNFHQSVVLICKHDDEGAVGIVINRLTDHKMSDIFEQLGLEISSSIHINRPVHEGGPVYPELGLVVHSGTDSQWESSMEIGESLHLTSSRDILEDMARGKGPDQVFMTLGYSGWGSGQLEDEISRNSWITTPADRSILFNTRIEDKWRQSAELIGIDISRYSGDVGHA